MTSFICFFKKNEEKKIPRYDLDLKKIEQKELIENICYSNCFSWEMQNYEKTSKTL